MTISARSAQLFPPDSGSSLSGLIVRPSTVQDTDDLLRLIDTVFSDMLVGEMETRMSHIARRVMSGKHPFMRPDDFTVVEDTRRAKQRIVGCTCLLRHTWEYNGVPFAVGRPEIIATYPEYRHQGLIRAIFAMVHERSAAQGQLVQAITGIPYFYRQFGYEYALDLWDTCVIPVASSAEREDTSPVTYSLRDATLADIPFLQKLYEQRRRAGLVSLVIDEQWWRYQIETRSNDPRQDINSHVQIIVDEASHPVGYVLTPVPQSKHYMQIWDMEVIDDISLHAALPTVLQALTIHGTRERETLPQDGALSELRFMLTRAHPIFRALHELYQPKQAPAYAWYVRVGDLPRFLARVAPVLEARLAHAGSGNRRGELKLDFYRGGLRLLFDNGHVAAEAWQRSIRYVKADAGFPPNVFLQLLFGHRTLAELRYAYPDVWATEEAEQLLHTLFPAKASWILPLW